MALATYEDVAVPLGHAITDEAQQAQVEWWLNGIERFIVNRLGPVAALNSADVIYVEAEAVAEKVRRNGRSESSITVAVDDANVTRRYENTPVNAGDITDEWWELLSGEVAGRGTVRMGWLL